MNNVRTNVRARVKNSEPILSPGKGGGNGVTENGAIFYKDTVDREKKKHIRSYITFYIR